ncbi:MAG: hypothetical protein COB12_04880 [Flavobacterium sp.]|nr:MAG: hypothetical protein COB12_04880 [Flavobacterium sp.]
MITDRPDATESPKTVPLKSVQIETGAFYLSNKDQGIKTELWNYNNTLIRYGILKNLELRLAFAISETREGLKNEDLKVVASGFSPLVLGAKVAITEEKGLLPDIGLMIHLALPFLASEDYKPETTGVSFRFAFAHTINKKSSLSYNLGARWGEENLGATYIYTLSYGYSITNKIGAYAEVYGNFPEDSSPNHSWDAGLTYLLKYNFQLDATIGSGFSGNQDLLLGAGMSYRFPN